jgi:hypothetical protein
MIHLLFKCAYFLNELWYDIRKPSKWNSYSETAFTFGSSMALLEVYGSSIKRSVFSSKTKEQKEVRLHLK